MIKRLLFLLALSCASAHAQFLPIPVGFYFTAPSADPIATLLAGKASNSWTKISPSSGSGVFYTNVLARTQANFDPGGTWVDNTAVSQTGGMGIDGSTVVTFTNFSKCAFAIDTVNYKVGCSAMGGHNGNGDSSGFTMDLKDAAASLNASGLGGTWQLIFNSAQYLLPDNAEPSWSPEIGGTSAAKTTATFTNGSATATIASATGVPAAGYASCTGCPVANRFTRSGTTLTWASSQTTTSAQTNTPITFYTWMWATKNKDGILAPPSSHTYAAGGCWPNTTWCWNGGQAALSTDSVAATGSAWVFNIDPAFATPVVTTASTHGNTTIDGIASTTGIKVGHFVWCASEDIPALTTVIAVGANSVTISASATASNASQSCQFSNMDRGYHDTAKTTCDLTATSTTLTNCSPNPITAGFVQGMYLGAIGQTTGTVSSVTSTTIVMGGAFPAFYSATGVPVQGSLLTGNGFAGVNGGTGTMFAFNPATGNMYNALAQPTTTHFYKWTNTQTATPTRSDLGTCQDPGTFPIKPIQGAVIIPSLQAGGGYALFQHRISGVSQTNNYKVVDKIDGTCSSKNANGNGDYTYNPNNVEIWAITDNANSWMRGWTVNTNNTHITACEGDSKVWEIAFPNAPTDYSAATRTDITGGTATGTAPAIANTQGVKCHYDAVHNALWETAGGEVWLYKY